MKAAQIETYGPADIVKIVDIEKPEAGPGKVLIKVHAASINPFDTTIREGYMKDTIPLQLPVTLGGDLAGIISAVGQDVTEFSVGDKVYGQANVVAGASGAFAEYTAAKASQIARMPVILDFMQAAAAPLTGVSALQVITDHMQLQSGQKVLIHGAAGGIGTIAVQIAKHLGAYVAATATGEGVDYVKQLGADEVIDYQTQRFEEIFHDFDAVFDTVSGETYERSFQVLKKGGIIVSMLAPPNKERMEQYRVTAILQQTRVSTESLNKLSELIDGGIVTIHIDKTYPLDKIKEAFEDRESGTVKGKVVLAIK